MSNEKLTTIDLQTQTATHLSAIELGLGSLLHAFKIPFSGHFLSLNQGFFLSSTLRVLSKSTSATRLQLSKMTFEISILTALLKSLSPAGQKWGPMLSISMQGILYSLGILVLGANIFGAILGMILLSLWAFIQPLITLIISFGFSEMQKIIIFYTERLENDFHVSRQNLWTVVATVFAIKIISAIAIAFIAFFMQIKKIKNIQLKLKQQQLVQPKYLRQNSNISIHKKVLKDITKPLFLFSFALAYIFLFITEKDMVSLIWKGLRPLAIAVLLFYLIRSETCHRLLLKLISKSSYLMLLYRKSEDIFNRLN
jgi:hypothetical protein